jgi:hypothetical protein
VAAAYLFLVRRNGAHHKNRTLAYSLVSDTSDVDNHLYVVGAGLSDERLPRIEAQWHNRDYILITSDRISRHTLKRNQPALYRSICYRTCFPDDQYI